MKDHMPTPTAPAGPLRKPYQAPEVRRASRVELITAGSFDLFVPNA